MTERRMSLWFAGQSDVQLIQTRFVDLVETTGRTSVRGKDCGAFRNAGTFQWTAAVRGLCILLIQAKLYAVEGTESYHGHLSGAHGSLASSLDYAMTKQPNWLRDMFGSDGHGTSLTHRLIARTNSNRKRPGPVILSLNERALDPRRISIDWNDQKIESSSALSALLMRLWNLKNDSDVPICDRLAA